jgi:hypothetical protein
MDEWTHSDGGFVQLNTVDAATGTYTIAFDDEKNTVAKDDEVVETERR